VNNHADDTFACDLETRLEDFFEGTPVPDATTPEVVEEPISDERDLHILRDLKSSVLAIDWEITDEGLNDFIQRVEELKAPLTKDKINSTFLKMLSSLGKYLLKHKSMAHPDTINRIMTVYTAVEKTVNNDALSAKEKEQLLMDEVKQFKRFKSRITKTRPLASPASVGSISTSDQATIRAEEILKAIDDLRAFMASELGAIRMELEKITK